MRYTELKINTDAIKADAQVAKDTVGRFLKNQGYRALILAIYLLWAPALILGFPYGLVNDFAEWKRDWGLYSLTELRAGFADFRKGYYG